MSAHLPDEMPPKVSAANVELETLAIEREKLAVERERLSVERYKARWSAFGVAVPLIAVAATVAFGIWGQYHKSRDDFALKAAEILLNSDSPEAVKAKALTLQTLFPSQLPPGFASSFDTSKFAQYYGNTAKDLIQLMAAKPESAMQTLSFWRSVFPGDADWVADIKKHLAAENVQSSSANHAPHPSK